MAGRNKVTLIRDTREIKKSRPYLVRWYGDYSPTTGKKTHYCRSFAKKVPAQQFKTEKQRELDAGAHRDITNITLDQLCDKYLESRQHNLRYATIQTYEYTIAQLKDHFSPDINIKHIKPEDAAQFISTREIINKSHLGKNKKLSAYGRNNHLTNAKKIFKSAVAWDYLTKNPFDHIERCKPEKRSWLHIQHVMFNKILNQVPDIRTKALLSVLYSGLRYGEAVNLTWATGIDFDRRRVNILNRDDGKYPFFKIKTYQQRSVPLCKQALKLLQQLKEQSNANKSPFVFITPRRLAVVLERWNQMKQEGISHKWSNAYWLNNVRRDFVKYCEQAGIETSEKNCLHVLRKSYAQNLADNSVPAITLCKLLGSTLRVVEQFYLRTSDANDKFAVDVLDRLMGDGNNNE